MQTADAQSDQSLRWAHMPFCWFCHALAHVSLDNLPNINSWRFIRIFPPKQSYRDWIHLLDSLSFYKLDNICDFLFVWFFFHNELFLKRGLKGNNWLPKSRLLLKEGANTILTVGSPDVSVSILPTPTLRRVWLYPCLSILASPNVLLLD